MCSPASGRGIWPWSPPRPLLTAVSAQLSISIPGDPVPITGQTFAVLLTGAALGARRGAAGQGLYVALGLLGLPVYAGGAAGPSVLIGATGAICSVHRGGVGDWAPRRGAAGPLPLSALPVFTVGSLIIFAFGVPWLAASVDISMARAVELGLVPFIPGGILKARAAAGLLPAAWRLVQRGGDAGGGRGRSRS
jgi:biotin transport system substrate-specific component